MGLRQYVLVARHLVAARDLPEREVGVVLEAAHLPRVIEVASVRRDRHSDGIVPLVARSLLLRLGLGDLHTGPAVHVVHPDLEGSEAPR